MTELPPAPAPYAGLVDPKDLRDLERAMPGAASRVLNMIEKDMELQAQRISVQDAREHKLRLLSTWLTMMVVLSIAGMATWVILAGHNAAGSILATVDLVALANVLINSWKR